jgi:hypothetical protein
MPGDEDELRDAVLEEFEWALKDPTEEKLRGLGEVVSTITQKMVEAIAQIDSKISALESQVSALDSKVSSLERGAVRAGPAGAPSPGAEGVAGMAKAPIVAAPKPVAASPGGGMMGELKSLLAARRRKTSSEPE